MKSKKIYTAAKIFLWAGIVLLLASLAVTFAYLTTQDFFPLEFTDIQLRQFVNEHLNRWESPTVVGGTTVLLLILAIILACVAHHCEKNEYEMFYEDAEDFTDEEYEFDPIQSTSETRTAKDVMSTVGEKLKDTEVISPFLTEKDKDEAEEDKKTLAIGAVALSAVVVGALAVSVSSNVKHAKQAKRRRDFYKWLG